LYKLTLSDQAALNLQLKVNLVGLV